MSDVAERLEELRESGLHRRLRLVGGAQGARVLLDGHEVLLLCSNNYLGLASHPRVREAAAEAALQWGAGAGASRLISGNMELHRELEGQLAAFKGYNAALLFGSGYLANIGAISALAGRGSIVFSDELNHASIVDGCRLARAETFVYRHGDSEHLAWGLREAGGRGSLIVSDGVFSMDGDVAPLADLARLARSHRCRLMVDEAHATGALGPGGRGSVAAAGLSEEVDLMVGTLGKTLGSYGAYVCASGELCEYLLNTARSFIFSTALPPPALGAASAALQLLEAEPERVQKLNANAAILRDGLVAEGLAASGSESQIVPLEVGDAERTMELCERLLKRGVFAQGIRPPTVPPGSSRLRFSVMATHEEGELREAARLTGETARELGIAAPRASGSLPVAARATVEGVFVTGTGTEVGKTIVAAAIAQTLARDGKRVAVFKPAVTGLDELHADGRDHEVLRGASGSAQSDAEIAPYRYGPPMSPHLAAELAGEEISPARLVAAARAACEGADVLVCEGVGGLLVPLTPRYLVRDFAADLALPLVVAAVPGLGTINHTLLTIEAARAAGLEVASVVLTPWPDDPTPIEESNRETIVALTEVRVETLPVLDLADPGSWPAIHLPPPPER